MNIVYPGIDLAKNIFQRCGLNRMGSFDRCILLAARV